MLGVRVGHDGTHEEDDRSTSMSRPMAASWSPSVSLQSRSSPETNVVAFGMAARISACAGSPSVRRPAGFRRCDEHDPRGVIDELVRAVRNRGPAGQRPHFLNRRFVVVVDGFEHAVELFDARPLFSTVAEINHRLRGSADRAFWFFKPRERAKARLRVFVQR